MAEITDTAMRTLFNEALQAVALGQSYTINGRELTRAHIREIRETIEWLDRRIAGASGKTGGIILTEFGEQE